MLVFHILENKVKKKKVLFMLVTLAENSIIKLILYYTAVSAVNLIMSINVGKRQTAYLVPTEAQEVGHSWGC